MNEQKSKSVIKISDLGQDRIAVSFFYNLEFVQKAKTLKVHKWHPEGKYWNLHYWRYTSTSDITPGGISELISKINNLSVIAVKEKPKWK